MIQILSVYKVLKCAIKPHRLISAKRKQNLGRWLVNNIYFLGHDMPQDFCIFIVIAIPVEEHFHERARL